MSALTFSLNKGRASGELKRRLPAGTKPLAQLLAPVHHDDHLRFFVGGLDHDEFLPVGRDVVVGVKEVELVVTTEERAARRDGEGRSRRIVGGDQVAAISIEEASVA